MVYVNEAGYLERKTNSGRRNPHGKGTKRDWWFVKHGSKRGNCGGITMGNEERSMISIPKEYLGKRIRFKVEVLE